MKLVVVESPGKIRKIQGFLGSGEYRVAASFGHVRDLPERDMGVAFDQGHIDITYQNISRNAKHIRTLKDAARDADEVILATDPDREGEAIAWHVRELLGPRKHHFTRIEFNQITKPAVLAALNKPRTIDGHLVNAQQARRVLDRLVGWMVSPVCWKHLGSGTSAGRVQSVAVRLVVEREREIRDFKVEVYHELWAWLWPSAHRGGVPEVAAAIAVSDKPPPGPTGAFRAKLIELNGKKVERTLVEPGWAQDLRQRFSGAAWTVRSVEKKERQRHAPPPFVTSTLQQAASNVMRWKPRRTMQIAQSLYEAGLITYMRTDSPSIAPEAVRAARDFIGANFPAAYLPPSPRYFKAKSAGAQEAHECVRPTDISKTPDMVSGQKPEAARLYRLIWERLVASQMAAAVYDDTVVLVDGEVRSSEGLNGLFEAKGSVQRFAGWLALTQRESDRDDERRDDGEGDSLPAVNEGEALRLARLDVRRAQTEPPRRYSQAALIRALEKEGIGRPATYASIMDTIITRGYVEEIERSLHATGLGEQLVDLLMEAFAGHFIELGFTRDAETALDRVAEGQQDWEAVVFAFKEAIDKRLNMADHLPVDKTVRRAVKRGDSAALRGKDDKPSKDGRARGRRAVTNEDGSHVVLAGDGEARDATGESEGAVKVGKRIERMSDLPPVPLERDCPLCGKKLERREGKFGKYVTCSAGKACKYKSAWLTEEQQAKVDALGPVVCPKCAGPLSPKIAKEKKTVFLSCLRYPDCNGLVGVDQRKPMSRGGKRERNTDGEESTATKSRGTRAKKFPWSQRGEDAERDEGSAEELRPLEPLAPIIELHPTKRGMFAVPTDGGNHGYATSIGQFDGEGESATEPDAIDLTPPAGIFEMPTSRFGMPRSERPSSGGLKRGKGLTTRTPLRPISKKKQAERAAGIRDARDTLRADGVGAAGSRGGGLQRNSTLRSGGSGFGKSKKPKGDGRFGPVSGKGRDAGLDGGLGVGEGGEASGIMPRCPQCDAPMVQRKSKHGAFYGCSLFPNCRGTRPAK